MLLHTCCAPCALSVIDIARNDGYDDIACFFDNPNIQPGTEFERRFNEVGKLCAVINIGYNPARYFAAVRSYNDPKKRCPECWRMRLDSSARYAREHGFDAFTTTLLSSPYQLHGVLKDIGEECARKYNVKFYYSDFRVDFRRAHDEAKKRGIYCQNYCGCVFSMVEREEQRKKKKR